MSYFDRIVIDTLPPGTIRSVRRAFGPMQHDLHAAYSVIAQYLTSLGDSLDPADVTAAKLIAYARAVLGPHKFVDLDALPKYSSRAGGSGLTPPGDGSKDRPISPATSSTMAAGGTASQRRWVRVPAIGKFKENTYRIDLADFQSRGITPDVAAKETDPEDLYLVLMGSGTFGSVYSGRYAGAANAALPCVIKITRETTHEGRLAELAGQHSLGPRVYMYFNYVIANTTFTVIVMERVKYSLDTEVDNLRLVPMENGRKWCSPANGAALYETVKRLRTVAGLVHADLKMNNVCMHIDAVSNAVHWRIIDYGAAMSWNQAIKSDPKPRENWRLPGPPMLFAELDPVDKPLGQKEREATEKEFRRQRESTRQAHIDILEIWDALCLLRSLVRGTSSLPLPQPAITARLPVPPNQGGGPAAPKRSFLDMLDGPPPVSTKKGPSSTQFVLDLPLVSNVVQVDFRLFVESYALKLWADLPEVLKEGAVFDWQVLYDHAINRLIELGSLKPSHHSARALDNGFDEKEGVETPSVL